MYPQHKKNSTILKQYTSDLRHVQSVINSISNVEVLANGATGLLNANSLNSLKTAVSGLSKEQALLVLSTKNLTRAQKEQVLVEAGIIASNDKINASIVQRTLAESTLTAEQQKDILTKLELINVKTGEVIATNACTKAALEEALAKKGIVGANAEAIISSMGLTSANATQTISFDLLTASIWANIKALGKWLVTNPIGWAILGGTAIFGLVKAYDALTDSTEEVKERTNALLDSYNSSISEANSNAKTIESLASRYETLSRGVNNLGENVSLTAAEYSEYNDIVNQIAEMFPTMITGYTDEGNAILSLKGNVEELRDAYKEAQKEAYNLLIVSGKDSDGNDIVTNYQNQLHGNESFLSTTSSHIDGEAGAKDAIDIITKLTGTLTPDEFRETYNQLYEEYENIWNSDKIQNALKSSGFEELTHASKWSEITTEDLANVKYSAQATIQTYQAEIDSQLQNVRTLANAYLMTNSDYEKLDEQSKTAASLLVNSIDESIANGFENKSDVGAYVAELITSISNNVEAQKALTKLFTMDTTYMSVGEIQSGVDSYISIIADAIDEDSDKLKVRLGFEDVDTQTLINNVKGKLKGTEFDEMVGELNLGDLQIAAEQVDVPIDSIKSWEELLVLIQKVKDKTAVLSFTEQISQIQALSQGLDQLDEIMADVMDEEDFDYSSILNNDNFTEVFGKYTDEYEKFIQTITNSPDDISKCQSAFDDLATAYVYGSGALANLTEESKDAAILDLEQMGISNATEVVEAVLNRYSEALQMAESNTFDLTNATTEEISEFLKNKDIIAETAEEFFYYALQKQLISDTGLSTDEECQQLINLANQTIKTTEVFDKFINLLNIIKSDNWGNATKELAKKEMQKLLADFNKVSVENYSGGSKVKEQAKKSAKDSADAYKEAFEKELKELQSLRDCGVIDESTYLERLRALYVHYFADRKEYLEEFRKYEQEYLEGMEDLYNNAISAVVKFKDKEIDALNKSKDAALDALEAEKEAREDVIDAQKEQLEYQVDLIDKQIDAKEEIIDGIQGEIDLIQDEIDAMESANKKRKEQINLQQKQYIYQKMMNQETELAYKDGQMIYRPNEERIRTARQELEDAEFDNAISEKEAQIAEKEKQINLIEKEIELFEKQKDAINEQIDALDKQSESIEKYYDNLIKQQEDYYNSLIENIEKEKSKWEELAEIKEVADAYSAIEQVFGNLGYTVDDVLNNSAGAFETFKNQYINLLDVMNSNDSFGNGLSYAVDELDKSLANVGTNTEGLDNLPAKMEEINASVGVVSDAFSGEKDSLQSSVQNVINKVAGSSEGNDKKDSSKDEEADTSSLIGAIQAQFDKTLEVIPQQIEVFTAYRDIVKSCVDEVYNLITATEKLATINISGIGGIPINGYATGTTHAKKGLAVLAEESPELVKDTNDNLSLVTKPTLVNMKGGEKVYNGDTTEGLLKATENEDGTITLSDGSILKPVELGYDVDKIVANMRANLGGINASINPIDKNIDTIVKTASNISNNHNNTQDINVSIGDIKLEGVQDVNGLAHAINTKLPNMMLQTLMKRK